MASSAITATSAEREVDRYLEAERALWAHYGLQPKEQFLKLEEPAARLRVLEFGEGEPVLFVHGTAGPGSWASLVSELRGFRCLVLDRPGWGLSSAIDFSNYEPKSLAVDVLRGVLDALGLARAHILGASIGNVWALGLAAQHPSRVDRVVLLGGSPLVPEIPVPKIIRLLASPLGALMVRLPDKPARIRSILRQNGHGPSLDAGRIPDEFVDWRVTLGRETDSMRNERDMVRASVVSGGSWQPGVTFDATELRSLERPALYVYGSADPVGSADVWKRTVSMLPRGDLHLVNGGGHMPWFDAPEEIGADVSRFLGEERTSS